MQQQNFNQVLGNAPTCKIAGFFTVIAWTNAPKCSIVKESPYVSAGAIGGPRRGHSQAQRGENRKAQCKRYVWRWGKPLAPSHQQWRREVLDLPLDRARHRTRAQHGTWAAAHGRS